MANALIDALDGQQLEGCWALLEVQKNVLQPKLKKGESLASYK